MKGGAFYFNYLRFYLLIFLIPNFTMPAWLFMASKKKVVRVEVLRMISNPEVLFKRQRETDYSLSLMKSQNYVFIMSFFSRAFKNEREKVRPKEDLLRELEEYMLDQKGTDLSIPAGTPEEILSTWCDDNHRWVLHNEDDTYELTNYSNRVFDYVDSSEQQFNEYKAEELWNTVLEKTSELAAELVTDQASRIAYHKRIIQELKKEMQKEQEAIDEILRTGIVKAKNSREARQMLEYIRQLLWSFQLEIGRYKGKTNDLIDGFNLKISDVHKAHNDDGKAIVELLDELRDFRNDKAYIVVDELSKVVSNSVVMDRLESEDSIIRRVFRKMNIPLSVDVYDEVNNNSLTIGKINSNYQTVTRRIQDMFMGNNREENRAVDYYLRQIDLLGKGLKNARWKELDKKRRMNLPNGECYLLDGLLLLAGKELNFTKKPPKQKEVHVEKLTAQKPNKETVSKPRQNNDIDVLEIRRRIQACLRKYPAVSLSTLAKEYPFTKGLREVSAYVTELVKFSGKVNVLDWEEFTMSYTYRGKKKNFTVYSAVLSAKEEKHDGYGLNGQ